MPRPKTDVWERFASYLQLDEETGCWNWVGNKQRDGYGMFNMGDGTTQTTAHRAAWMLFRGKIPPKHDVSHRCIGNYACVNPEHLYTSSHKANLLEAWRRAIALADAELAKETI